MDKIIFKLFLVQIVFIGACLAGVNLDIIFEKWLRSHKNFTFGTDESFYAQSPILSEYDFIVVGSGPGGAAVASRLSEIPDWTVLLAEAGKEPTIILDVPMFVTVGPLSTFNWGFKAQYERGACQGLTEGRCRWPRGKCLGGTSTINYMIYTRGNKEDFDLWQENGNRGWGFKDVLPYFLKSENNEIPFLRDSIFHARGGPVTVDLAPFKTKLSHAFLQAGREMGYNIIDYNNGTPPLGFSPVQGNLRNGRRVSAERAYLRPIKNRKNLQVSLLTRVTKILIHPETKRAYGVELVKHGKTYVVFARKEVILSAGALQSPQLLMLSGVGPQDHLREMNIPVIQNLPGVGQNLQEHVTYSGLTFLVNQTGTAITAEGLFNINNFIEFFEKGKGLLTLPGGVEGLAYINTKYNDDPRGRPDIELIFASGSFPTDNGILLRKGIGVTDEIYDKTFKPFELRESWTIWPMILHPKSRGYIKLRSRDPFKAPLFYANYFQHQQDLDTLVEGIKFAVELSKTKAFQKYGSYLNTIPLAGCENYLQNSDKYWKCAVRSLTTTLHHQSGTCKMGPPTDPMAVVDPELRVYGIKNLRVIDASIIPQLVTAHTTAPVYMIGEKGSDIIKETWKNEINRYFH